MAKDWRLNSLELAALLVGSVCAGIGGYMGLEEKPPFMCPETPDHRLAVATYLPDGQAVCAYIPAEATYGKAVKYRRFSVKSGREQVAR